MKNVGASCTFLKASAELRTSLQAAGERQRYSSNQPIFREEENARGVYLVLRGKVSMGIGGLPKLDRLFSVGSLLGLPATFTGRPYSLTAVALTDVDLMHVAPESFLQLMRDQPELCRQAAEMLGREVTFIQSALAQRRKQVSSNRVASELVMS